MNEYLKGQGYEYVGDCADAQLPRDKGKWCSTLVSTDAAAGTETYDVGLVGEKPTKKVTVKRRGAAQLTPGYQVAVGEGNVGQPSQLTREQLEANAFITGNLLLDQAAGIGNGLERPPGGRARRRHGWHRRYGRYRWHRWHRRWWRRRRVPPVTTPVVPQRVPAAARRDRRREPDRRRGRPGAVQGLGLPAQRDARRCASTGTRSARSAPTPRATFAGSISIPKGTAPGTHLLTVQGTSCSFNATINVAGNLAFTGSSSNTSTYVLVGIAAVVVGLVLVVGSPPSTHGVREPLHALRRSRELRQRSRRTHPAAARHLAVQHVRRRRAGAHRRGRPAA